MTKVDVIRNLYQYNEWANGTVLEAAAGLGADDFSCDRGASFGSVEGNLAHLLGAQVVWLQRWPGGANSRSFKCATWTMGSTATFAVVSRRGRCG